MKKESVKKLIDSFFEEIEWKYKFDEEKSNYAFGVDMGNVIGNLKFVLLLREHHYKVYAILNSKVEQNHFDKVAEYLHRANYGMNNGNFEIDYRDGEVRYKTYIDFQGVELSKGFIEESIFVPLIMFERYGKNLIKLMLGDGVPEDLIKDSEKEDED